MYVPNYKNLRTECRRKRNVMMKKARHYQGVKASVVSYFVSEARFHNRKAVEFDRLLKGKSARDFR